MPPAGQPPTEAAARIGDTGFATTFLWLRPACHARSRRVGRAGVHAVGASARSCCSRLTRVVSSFSWPVVLTAPLLVSFYSFLVCWRSVGGAGMVVVLVVLVERLVAREKRKQELRLRAAVQMKTSKPLPTPQRAFPGEVKPKPPPAGPTREVHQVSYRFEQFPKNMFYFYPNDPYDMR